MSSSMMSRRRSRRSRAAGGKVLHADDDDGERRHVRGDRRSDRRRVRAVEERACRARTPSSRPAGAFTFCWDELVTTDPAAAERVLREGVRLVAAPVDMGGGMTYTLLDRPGIKNAKGDPVGAGGVMKSPPGVPYSFWLPTSPSTTPTRCASARRVSARKSWCRRPTSRTSAGSRAGRSAAGGDRRAHS